MFTTLLWRRHVIILLFTVGLTVCVLFRQCFDHIQLITNRVQSNLYIDKRFASFCELCSQGSTLWSSRYRTYINLSRYRTYIDLSRYRTYIDLADLVILTDVDEFDLFFASFTFALQFQELKSNARLLKFYFVHNTFSVLTFTSHTKKVHVLVLVRRVNALIHVKKHTIFCTSVRVIRVRLPCGLIELPPHHVHNCHPSTVVVPLETRHRSVRFLLLPCCSMNYCDCC